MKKTEAYHIIPVFSRQLLPQAKRANVGIGIQQSPNPALFAKLKKRHPHTPTQTHNRPAICEPYFFERKLTESFK